MTSSRLFTCGLNNILNSHNLFCNRNTILQTSVRCATLSNKSLEKLGLPVRPKRPLLPYIRFAMSARPKILENQPEVSSKEIMKLIAQEWKTCDPELKEQYQKDYLLEKEEYTKKTGEYKNLITEEQKELIKNTIQLNRQKTNASKIKEKKKALGIPKKPLSPFLQFVADNSPSRDKNMKQTDWLKQCGNEWKNLSEDIKEEYRKSTKAKDEIYKKELLEWEEKMIRNNHLDVIRNKELLENPPKKKYLKKNNIED